MSEPKRRKDDLDEDGQLKCQARAESVGRGVLVTSNRASFPVEILPPELWELIFKHLDNPKDLLACWNTSNPNLSWATALRSTDFYFKMAFWFVLPYLSRRDILVCSTVSKLWNGAVDACIQNYGDLDNRSSLNRGQRCVTKRMMVTMYTDRLTKFLDKLNLSTSDEPGEKIIAANPVAFRYVTIKIPVDDRFPQGETPAQRLQRIRGMMIIILRELKRCVEYNGHLIQNLFFKLSTEWINNPSVHDQLKLIHCSLVHTPNLRFMHILTHDEALKNKRELQEFNAFITKYPWPALEHLKVLKLGSMTNREEYASLVKTYAHQIHLFQFDPQLMGHCVPFATRFSCLREIVFLFSNSNSFSGTDFAAFMQSIPSPVKHLDVLFVDSPAKFKNTEGLVMAVNAKSSSLESLTFYRDGTPYKKRVNFDVTKFEQMRLSRLTRLDLSAFGYPSLQFLQRVCPALQKLILRPYIFIGANRKIGETEKMYSNMYSQHQFWNGLTHIQYVSVSVSDSVEGSKRVRNEPPKTARRAYTRLGYERILEHDRAIRSDNQ